MASVRYRVHTSVYQHSTWLLAVAIHRNRRRRVSQAPKLYHAAYSHHTLFSVYVDGTNMAYGARQSYVPQRVHCSSRKLALSSDTPPPHNACGSNHPVVQIKPWALQVEGTWQDTINLAKSACSHAHLEETSGAHTMRVSHREWGSLPSVVSGI